MAPKLTSKQTSALVALVTAIAGVLIAFLTSCNTTHRFSVLVDKADNLNVSYTDSISTVKYK